MLILLLFTFTGDGSQSPDRELEEVQQLLDGTGVFGDEVSLAGGTGAFVYTRVFGDEVSLAGGTGAFVYTGVFGDEVS